MQPIKMEEKLQQARFALMTMFEVIEEDIVEMKSRKQNRFMLGCFIIITYGKNITFLIII